MVDNKFCEFFYTEKGGDRLLLIQDISLTWQKEERGAVCAAARREFPEAYLLENTSFVDAITVYRHDFYQKGTEFKRLEDLTPKARIAHTYWLQTYSAIQDLNFTNLSFQMAEDDIEVTFFYDQNRSGRPFRRGHNKDFNNPQSPLCGRDCLNETAFALKQGQYGRIKWNERRTDSDDGIWYYKLHIINLLYLSERKTSRDIFMSKILDYEYRQISALR